MPPPGHSRRNSRRCIEGVHAPGHRCETVRTLDGVLWLNDSKATNLHALEAALKSQHSPSS